MSEERLEDVCLCFELGDGSKLPELDEIRIWFEEAPRLFFYIERISICQRAWTLLKFKLAFPRHRLQSWEEDDGVWTIVIARRLPAESIRGRGPEIVAAVRDFVETALCLTDRLGERLGTSAAELSEFAWRNDHWSGSLDTDWVYWFHGQQVRFENNMTGQMIDVNLCDLENRESLLDVWFVLQYLRTTPRWKELALFFPDGFDDMRASLKVLKRGIRAALAVEFVRGRKDSGQVL